MIHAQTIKEVELFKPQQVATNGTASGTVNVAGWDYAIVRAHLDSAASTSNTDVVLRVSEGDTTSSFATATEMLMTTAAPATNASQFYHFYLDLRKRKKFLKFEYSPSASGARQAVASIILSRPEQAPTTAAGRGLAGQVIA